jgi:hypothetical protein
MNNREFEDEPMMPPPKEEKKAQYQGGYIDEDAYMKRIEEE